MNEIEQLRNLLNLTNKKPTPLFEANGIGNRKPGDRFIPTDPESGMPDLRVDNINFYPSGGFIDDEEWVEQLEDIESQYPDIIWVNNPPKEEHGGFGVAVFSDDRGTLRVYGKFYKTINANNASNAWHNQTGLPDYRFGGRAVMKAEAAMEPADVLTQLSNLSAEDIVDQIAVKFGDDSPLTELAEKIARGASFPLIIPAVSSIPFEAFRDGFTELLHPIALKSGSYTGNADDAADIFLANGGFEEATITFNLSKTEGLSDSMFSNVNGERLQISSKAGKNGKGAAASVKNLSDALVEMRKTNLPAKFYKDNATAIHLIETIASHDAYNGPIALGIQYNIINENEAKIIRELRSKSASGELSYVDVRDGDYLTKNLKTIYLTVQPTVVTSADAFNTMSFGLAKTVAEEVNKTSEFTKAASAILNNSALVQVYTKAKIEGNNWVITDFNSKFPSSAVTEVLLSSKNYATTKNNGKFAFSIGKDGGSPEKDIKKPPAKVQTKSQKKSMSKKKAQSKKRNDFSKDNTDKELYGREKSYKSRDKYDNWFTDRYK